MTIKIKGKLVDLKTPEGKLLSVGDIPNESVVTANYDVDLEAFQVDSIFSGYDRFLGKKKIASVMAAAMENMVSEGMSKLFGTASTGASEASVLTADKLRQIYADMQKMDQSPRQVKIEVRPAYRVMMYKTFYKKSRKKRNDRRVQIFVRWEEALKDNEIIQDCVKGVFHMNAFTADRLQKEAGISPWNIKSDLFPIPYSRGRLF